MTTGKAGDGISRSTGSRTAVSHRSKSLFIREMKRHGFLYMIAVPGILFLFVFNYLPMFGTIVAFKRFNYRDGLFGSPWAGFENFRFLFGTRDALKATYNTIFLNFLFIVFGTALAVVLALLLNEIKSRKFKKVSQSVILMPYFLSWIVISVIVYTLINYEHGTLNTFLKSVGAAPVNLYNNARIWPALLTVIHCWKSVGLNMVIYLAVLVGVNQEYYDAAMIDGAGKFKQVWYISLPSLVPVIITLTILAIGRIMNADFGMFYSIVGNNSVVYSTADVIDTFVYRVMRNVGDIGMSSAAGFLQSVIGCLLVLSVNLAVRRISPENALF
jgi:putative aldouronate transport system permease protein